MASTIVYKPSNFNEYGFITDVDLGNTEDIFKLAYDVIVDGSAESNTDEIVLGITIDQYGRTIGGTKLTISDMVQSQSSKLLSMADGTYGDSTHSKWNPTTVTSITVDQYGRVINEPTVKDYPGYEYNVLSKLSDDFTTLTRQIYIDDLQFNDGKQYESYIAFNHQGDTSSIIMESDAEIENLSTLKFTSTSTSKFTYINKTGKKDSFDIEIESNNSLNLTCNEDGFYVNLEFYLMTENILRISSVKFNIIITDSVFFEVNMDINYSTRESDIITDTTVYLHTTSGSSDMSSDVINVSNYERSFSTVYGTYHILLNTATLSNGTITTKGIDISAENGALISTATSISINDSASTISDAFGQVEIDHTYISSNNDRTDIKLEWSLSNAIISASDFSSSNVVLAGNLLQLTNSGSQIFDYISDQFTNYTELRLYRIEDISYLKCSVDLECSLNKVYHILTDQQIPLVCNLKLFGDSTGLDTLSNLMKASITVHHYYHYYPDNKEYTHSLINLGSTVWYNSHIKTNSSDTGGLDLIFRITGDFSLDIYSCDYSNIYNPISGDDSVSSSDDVHNWAIYLVDNSCQQVYDGIGNYKASFNYIYATILNYLMNDNTDITESVFSTNYVSLYKKYIAEKCADIVALGVNNSSSYNGLYDQTKQRMTNLSDVEDFLTKHIGSAIYSWENYDYIVLYGDWFSNDNYTYEKYVDADHTAASLAQEFNNFINYNMELYPEKICTFDSFLINEGYLAGGVKEFLNTILWYFDLVYGYTYNQLYITKQTSLTMDMYVAFYNAPLDTSEDICKTTNLD